MSNWPQFKFEINRENERLLEISGFHQVPSRDSTEPCYAEKTICLDPCNIPVLLKLLDRDLKEYTQSGFRCSEKGKGWEISCSVEMVRDDYFSYLRVESERRLPDGTKAESDLMIPYRNSSRQRVYEYIGPFLEELKKYIP